MTYARIHVRRTLIPFLLIAALTILLVIPSGISAQGSGPDGDPVWSADMLVVEYTEISIGAATADLFSNVGGTGNLQIKSLWSYVPDSDLRLAFTDGVPDADNMTLKVGNLELEFPVGSSENSSFKWTGVDVDWKDGETIAVSIVRTSTLTEPAGNTQATGGPTITGTPQVDQTLTADTSSITDEDGLESVSYEYQWVRSDNGEDSDIAGATEATYTLVYADQGKTIKVKVTFTDDAENEEILISEAAGTVTAAPNRAATGDPTIDGTPQVNQTLTAGTAAISDEDGLDAVSYEYQWTADDTDLDEATGGTYTPSTQDVGKTIKVKVSFTDNRNNEESRTSAATSAVLATVPGQPQSLTVTAGDNIQELDASWQTPSSNGGSDVTGYKVQWKEAAHSWDTAADVSEATVTGTSLTITSLTGGVEYTVRVIASNAAGDGPASAEAKGTPAGGVSEQQPIEPANSAPTGLPTISGSPQVEQTLTADTSDIDDDDGLTNVSYEYQWLAGGLEISGATSSSYQLTSSERGKTVQVRVTFTDDADNQETLTSEPTVSVAAKPNNEATGAPTILGTVQASETLTVETSKISDADGIDNAIFEYQWISNDGTTDTDITGGTNSTYIIKPWDLGKYLKVRVRFTDDAGNAEALTSIATTAVEASPNQIPTGAVRLSGMAEVGQALTAKTHGIYDANGLWYDRFSYQWIRNDGTTDVDIQDATNPGYVLTDADEGKTIRVRLSFTDDGANPETLTSSATAAVAARPRASDLGQPIDLTVGWSQGQEKGLELQWTAPEGAVTSYQILRLEIPTRSAWWEPYDYGCTPLMRVHVNDTGSDATTYTDTDVGEGASYIYSVRAINEDGVGRRSSSPRDLQYRPHGYWPSGLPGSPWRAPANLSSSQIKNGIGLTWDAPEGEVTGYQILRRAPEQCDYGYRVYVENTNSTDTHWADRNVVAGTRYEYYVKAVNDVGAGRLDTRVSTSLRPTALVIGPEPNNEATGTPTITGTAQVGQTLTADPSGIADADGMHWATFSYQWLSSRDTEIEGATSSTYKLQASDANKVIKVRVDFMDDSGYEESLTSAATAAVSPNISPTGAPSITGTVEVGETLTADTSGIADPDGLENVSYRYQWIRSDGTDDWEVDGATGSTYAVTPADVDKAIKLRVDFTDDKGSVESLTSSATSVVPIEAAFTFNIDGTTVTCDSYNVHIEECDVISSTDQGASGEFDVAIEIVRSANSQLYKFDFGIVQQEDSIGQSSIVAANDLCLGPGLADSVTMEVTPDDGNGNFTYTDQGTIFRLCPAGIYQLFVRWYRYNYEDQEYEDAGVFRRFFLINGVDEEDTSIEQVGDIYASYPDTPVSHEEVQIEGTKLSTRLNRTLTTFALSIDGLVPDTDTETTDYVVRVRVIGNDAHSLRTSGSYGRTVPWCHVGNVGYSYLLKTVPENGRWEMDAHVKGSCLEHWWPDRLQVELFDGPDLTDYSKPIVFDGSLIISHTGERLYPEHGTHEFIAGKYISLGALSNTDATGVPSITGTPQVDETLTADTSAIADADGLDNVSYAYQWIANDGNSDTEIEDATDSTYTPSVSDVGKTVKVRVTFTDDAENQETLTSEATVAVAATVPTAPLSLTVTPGGQIQELNASWQAPSSNGGSDVTGYKVQWKESTDSWDTETDVSEATVTGTSHTITGLTGGVEYSVRVVATNIAGDGPGTTEARATPADITAAWTATLTVGVSGSGSEKVWGYNRFVDEMGTLDETTFSEGDQSIEVTGILLANGSVAITVRPHLTNDFVLTVDGTKFASADAREVKSTTIISYIWPATLEWAEDDTVELSLTLKDSTETSGTPQQAEIWSATLTVGTTDEFAGYTTFLMSSESNILGSLSSDTFTLDGAIYTAKALGVLNGKLIFSVMPKLSADFVMVVGTDELASTDAATQESASVLQYQWNGSGLTWSEGEEVAVRLTAPDDNTPPTGLPTISGTAEIGETLTADTSGIADENGMDNVEFSYQWIRVDDDTETEIEYAAASTYTPGVKDVYKKVKVEVTFTDEDGHEESLTSKLVGPVSLKVYADSVQKNVEQSSGEQISNLPREFWSATMTAASIEDTHVGFYSGENPAGSLDDPTFTYVPGDDFDYTVNLVALDDDYLSVRINGSIYLSWADTSQWTLSVNGQEFQVDEAVWNDDIFGHPAKKAGMMFHMWFWGGIRNGEFDYSRDFYEEQLEYWYREPVRGWQWPRGDLSFSDGDTVNLSLKDITPPSFSDFMTFVPSLFPIGFALHSDLEDLDQVNLPSPSDFTITSDDTVVTVGEVLPYGGGVIWLGQLSPAIKQGQTVILSYTDPTSADDANAFQDLFGNDAADFTFTVTNFSLLQTDISQSPATGAPTINGTAQVGQVLTAETSGIADENGLTIVEYSYQWLFDDGTEIDGATDSTYTLQEADVGKAVKVKVSFRDDAAYKESLTSIATVAVTATLPTEPLSLTVSAGDQIQELDVSWQAPSSNGGSDVTGYKVQWKESAHSWDTAADVSEATVTGTSHTITSLTGGVEYTVRVIASNVAGDGPASTEVKGTPAGGVSEQQAIDPANSAPTGLPTINGTPQVEQTLTADTSGINDADGLTNVSNQYQWIAGGTDISGATGSTYELTSSEQGKTIQVRVTFTDDADNQETLTSEATTAVAAKPNTAPTGLPTINGTPQVEQTLTADTSGINDADGLTNVSYEYQWIAGGTDISGATGSTYELTGSEQGKTIQVRVTFTDDADNVETLTSEATTAVAAKPNTAPTGLPTISGTPQVEQTLTADTSGINDADGLTKVSYEYQWIAGGTDISGAIGSTYKLTSSEQGKTIQVRVTFTDDADNSESLTSEATDAVAAKPVPLTATFSNVPASHSGSGTTFTFDLAFSENFPLSYITLRDHAFSEDDDGPVTKAQRKVQGSNQTWTITVEPQGNGAITVTLPATTDCNDSGAICTSDGRKLSNSLSFTVSGPSQ